MVLHVPYSFVPGTKARAEEVNANFNAVLEKIDTKANSDLSNLSQNGINTIKNNVVSRNLGELVYSLIPPNDSCLHLLDGTKFKSTGAYSDFVEYIATLYTKYPALFTTEENWQKSVTDYGVCGKFVYDSENSTVRLPKITGVLEGTTDLTALGDLVEAGLPNITGTKGTLTSTGGDTSLYGGTKEGHYASTDATTPSGLYHAELKLDASKSSPIYGNSDTVQPQTIKILVYMTVGTSSKTDIQVNIDSITGDLNGKVDVDLINANPSQSFKNTVISWGLPDYNNGIETAFNNNTATDTLLYTTPDNGVIRLAISTSGNDGTSRLQVKFINAEGLSIIHSLTCPKSGSGNNDRASQEVIVTKNTKLYLDGKTLYGSQSITFYPFIGGAN